MSVLANRTFEISFSTLAIEIILKSIDGKPLRSSTILPSGWDMIEATLEFLKNDRNILTNRLIVANLIKNIGSAIQPISIQSAKVIGRNLISGLPDKIDVSAEELYDVLESLIVSSIHNIVMRLEIEISLLEDNEVLDNTITLTGDFSYFRQLDIAIEKTINEILLLDVTVKSKIY